MTDVAQRVRIRRLFCAEHGKLGTIASELDVVVIDVPDRE